MCVCLLGFGCVRGCEGAWVRLDGGLFAWVRVVSECASVCQCL